MTEKQFNIIQSALELFAERGYASTPTSLVAKTAGVSEGLIFRHFESKEGLLQAILDQGHAMAEQLMMPILSLQDPKEILRSIFKTPFEIDEKQYHFWKLLYALKWQTDRYDHSRSEPIYQAMVNAFHHLGYQNPVAEAEVGLVLLDGLATAILLRKPDNIHLIYDVILKKYDL